MSDTKEDLESLWERLWARGRELDERQERLLSSVEGMEPALFDRAMDQLDADRRAQEADLLDLKRRMREHGGFE